MNIFPFLGSINPTISKTIKDRGGKNLDVSKLTSWIRVASAVSGNGHNGLVLESVNRGRTFANTYGRNSVSGVVGFDFNGKEVFAPDNERGLRPSPVVESLTIENGNRGLSRKASFTITAFTLGQAEKLLQHFVEPGFTVLVEFGWNSPDVATSKINLAVEGACGFVKMNQYNTILNKRLQSNGKYDGFMGYITGGGLSFGDNETYIISVELTTIGEIPTYLQTHRTPANEETPENTSLTYDVALIEGEANTGTANKIGRALWRQFYNRLPGSKRTQAIKNLINAKDIRGNLFSEPYNFINVDEKIREFFMEGVDQAKVNDIDIDIPEGVNLITDQSYVRFELLARVLNEFSVNLEPAPSGECTDKLSTYSYIIDTNYTICRGHKWMFSLDPTKLYIPNEYSPRFGVEALFQSKEELDIGSLIDYEGIEKGTATINANPWKAYEGGAGNSLYAFPQSRTALPSDLGDSIRDVKTPVCNPHTWGFLRDLYVNLDFFVQVLERSNYVAKDVMYELLNGISAAANSYWEFDICENPDNTRGDSNQPVHMVVRDLTFTGEVEPSEFNDEIKYPTFDSIGSKTPFLNFNINMDIPAVMRNSILGKASSSEVLVEGRDSGIKQFFGGQTDPVRDIFNSFKVKKKPAEPSQATEAQPEPDVEEIRKANLENFGEIGTLVPLLRDRDETRGWWYFTNADEIDVSNLIVGAFNDPTVFKILELKWLQKEYPASLDSDSKGTKLNPRVLGVEVTFDIHGISGLKIGDMFKLNQLPKGYDKPFQIMETSHNLSDGQWITSVKARMRNL